MLYQPIAVIFFISWNILKVYGKKNFIELFYSLILNFTILILSYSGGDDNGRFSIGVDSGLVTLARPLDREDLYIYNLIIQVTDGVHKVKSKVRGIKIFLF